MNPTLILPKGRLYNDIQKFFQLKGFLLPDENSRQYYFPNWFEECNLFIAKPKAIPQLLYSKMAEFAFCGNDIINNSDYNQSIYPIYSTGLNKIKICLCSRLDKETLLHLKRPVIVASEFEIIASRYFTNLGVPHYIINTGGSTEGYLDLNADCIIDVDFEGVKTITTKFAGKLFGRLYDNLGKEEFYKNIHIINMSNDVKISYEVGLIRYIKYGKIKRFS